MPYNSNNELPQYVKKYPEKVQRMWRHVWMSVYQKTGDETRAFKAANSVLKKNMEKFGIPRYGYNAHFNYMVDNFLGRLPG